MSFHYTNIASVISTFYDEPYNLRAVIDKLSDVIIDSYNGDVFSNYKRDWSQAVVNYFRTNEIELLKTKPNWDNIAAAVVDRLVVNSYDFQKQAKNVNRSSVSGPSGNASSGNVSSGNVSSSNVSFKQVKLTAQDKHNIKTMYASLDKKNMWKLSTGTLVEEKMLEHAIKQDYEHLCHSLIFHVEDDCWNDYFSQEEINEISNAHALQLPSLPVDIKIFIEQLEATPKNALYENLNSVPYPLDSDQKWVQDAYNSCLRLIKSGYFPLRGDVTEQGIGKRMWSCVDKCFDFSSVRCVSGEKCSKASADAANLNRSFSSFDRQQCGRKVDYLFKTKDEDVEVGCGECALVGGVHTTKEFQDAYYKMPKVLRDMMFKIVRLSPGLLHKLHMTGLYIADNMLTLWILDAPLGYVSRYYAFDPVQYPITESKIGNRMTPLLTMILCARIIMQDCQVVIDNDKSAPSLGRYQPLLMEPCFVSSVSSSKKRKE